MNCTIWFWIALLGLFASFPQAQSSLRSTVGSLAAKGALDSAQAWIAAQLASDTTSKNDREAKLLLGQLTLRGSQAIRPWQELRSERATSAEQAEALYLLGQYHYAGGRYHLAVPQFRDYLRRYPEGDDADRAGYWMANACLHLALTQPERSAYLDTGLAYLKSIPSLNQPDRYYAALATECQAKLLLAKNDAKAADSVLSRGLVSVPDEEKPAFFLLKAQILRTQGKAYSNWIDSLNRHYPGSPETQYASRFGGKIPAAQMIKETKKDSAQDASPAARKDSSANAWVLQVGSFAQRDNAQAFLDQLTKQGFQARMMTTPRGHQTLWQVWLGAFPSADAAEQFGKKELTPKQILYTARLIEP